MKDFEKAVNVPAELSWEIAEVFALEHQAYIWPALDKMGISKYSVVGEMWRMRDRIAIDTCDSIWILYYGLHHLQPLINKKMGRNPDYPSWNELLLVELATVIRKNKTVRRKQKIMKENASV